MIFEHDEKRQERILKQAMSLLDRWYIAASDHGYLWIQPMGASFRLDEFSLLIKRLSRIRELTSLKRVFFEFSNGKITSEQWAVLVGLIAAFAKQINADCSLVGGRDRGAEQHPAGQPKGAGRFCLVLESHARLPAGPGDRSAGDDHSAKKTQDEEH